MINVSGALTGLAVALILLGSFGAMFGVIFYGEGGKPWPIFISLTAFTVGCVLAGAASS